MTDTPAPAGATPDPLAILRSKNFIAVLVLAAVIGVVVSLVSGAFLEIVHNTQKWPFTDLPDDFGCVSSRTVSSSSGEFRAHLDGFDGSGCACVDGDAEGEYEEARDEEPPGAEHENAYV